MQVVMHQQWNHSAIEQNNLNVQLNQPVIAESEKKYIELDDSVGFDLKRLNVSSSCRDYNYLLKNNGLFRAAKQQFLSDIKQLQELAYMYTGNQYQGAIANFYIRVKTPFEYKYKLNDEFKLYMDIRKHIHFLVQKLTEAQAKNKDNHVDKAGKQTTINEGFLIYILAVTLEELTYPSEEVYSRLKNVYNSLTLSENDNYISLQLSNLTSINFGNWPSSTIYTLLSQALNQTKKTEDIVAFFCNPNIADQLIKLPQDVAQSLTKLLNTRMAYDESFKNDLYQSVRDYIKNPQFNWQNYQLQKFHFTPLFKISKLNVDNRINWLLDTPLMEPILLKLCKKNIGIGFVKKSLSYQQISNFSYKSIKKIFTEEECKSLLIQVLESKSKYSVLIFKLIKEAYPGLLKMKNSTGMTALHLAAKNNSFDLMVYLITLNIISVNQQDNDGQTPLHVACYHGNTECIKLLLLQPNIHLNTNNNYNKMPLEVAICRGNAECVELLIHHDDIDLTRSYSNYKSGTILHVSCEENQPKCLEKLLECEQINPNKTNIIEKTPLNIACYLHHTECVDILLAHARVNPYIPGLSATALHIACMRGSINSVRKLLNNPETNVNATDAKDRTALYYSCQKGRLECVVELLANKITDVNSTNKYGDTALMIACEYGHTECVKALVEDERVDVNIKACDGNTAADIASKKSEECLRALFFGKLNSETKHKYFRKAFSSDYIEQYKGIVWQ